MRLRKDEAQTKRGTHRRERTKPDEPASASRSLNVNQFTLISFIGADDSALIKPFLEHHRSIGVTAFHLILHGAWQDSRLDYLAQQNGVLVKEHVTERYSEALLRRKYNELIATLTGQWVVLVDGDELLELPYSSLGEVAERMRILGINDLPAFLVQRLSADGSLCEVGPDSDLTDQFPMMNFNLCEDLFVANPTWKDKFPFFYVTPHCVSRRGNHVPPNGLSPSNAPIRAVLHHFKWTAKFRDKLDNWKPGSGRGNDNEFAAYKQWFAKNDYRLPTEASVEYSRDELFRQGLLVAPSAYEQDIASTISACRVNRTDADKEDAKRRLNLLAPSAMKGSPTCVSLTDPQNLLMKPGRVCFVTLEISGLTTSGGIGTAVGGLAESLAESGHHVEVVFCPFRGPRKVHHLWADYWSARGVTLHYLRRDTEEGYPRHLEFNEQLDALLDTLDFDVVHFVDAAGYGGRFSRLVTAQGRRDIRIITTVHGPGDWHRRGNLIPWQEDESFETAGFTYMLELSDVVIFPSEYMMNWAKERYRITANHAVIPNVLPGTGRSFSPPTQANKAVSEIVFFGRVEPRKGFDTFCEALNRLASAVHVIPQVTVMGKLGDKMTIDRVHASLASLGASVKVIENYGNVDAINYLKTRKCVAVIPSKVDNLPYTVYESVENGIPLMTTPVGGISELLDEHDHDRVLVAGHPETLAAALAGALQNGFKPARPGFQASLARAHQLALHARLVAEARGDVEGAASRGTGTSPTVETIRYGSTDSDATLAASPSRAIGRSNEDGQLNWAVQTNCAVHTAQSDLIRFVHHSVHPSNDKDSELLQKLLCAGGYEAVVSDCYLSNNPSDLGQFGPGRMPTKLVALGRPAEISALANLFGAGNFMIRRSVFHDLGGFNERLADSQYAHWELLNRLLAKGYTVGAVPVPLAVWDSRNLISDKYQLDHKLIEFLIRPWLGAMGFAQQNLFRLSVFSLIDPHKLMLVAQQANTAKASSRLRRGMRAIANRLRKWRK